MATSRQSSRSSTVDVTSFVSVKLHRDENNQSNYGIWKEQMLILLEILGLVEVVEAPSPHDPDSDWRQTDSLVKGWILETLSEEVIKDVAISDSARAAWLILEHKFSESSPPAPPPPPPPPAPPSPPPALANQGNEWHKEMRLYRAALRGDWNTARQHLEQDPSAVTSRLGLYSEPALHVAVAAGKSESFVTNLLNLIDDASLLAFSDSYKNNPLHIAVTAGNYHAVEKLVTRCPTFLYLTNCLDRFPLHSAADFGYKKILQLLISVTRDDLTINPFEGNRGLMLLLLMVGSDLFDVALDLISIYPYMVGMNPLSIGTILKTIAAKTFSSDDQLCFWKHPIHWLLCNNKFNEKKMMREHALRLVKCLCNHMESLEFRYATIISKETILTAAQSGNHNIVEEIVETFPLAILSTNSSGQNFLHLAVKNRCDKVFNLMYQTSNYKFNYSDKLDEDGNSILHFVARLAPTHKLNLVSGAALQMQRELQWFQEASKFVTPYTRGVANHSGETAEKIFTEEHKELKIEGEKWMKDTANSCTIAAALIATVVFAAAITVPGGNQSESGYPMFYQSSAFKLFAVSDSISLFTSTTSLLMFLSILTSRYAEQDFLYALPKRLCIGLLTLFVSILFMMIAFSSTVYLVFGRKNAWVLIAVGVLASMPISSFVLLQFPLLRDVISSTYGRGIFGKQSDRPFH